MGKAVEGIKALGKVMNVDESVTGMFKGMSLEKAMKSDKDLDFNQLKTLYNWILSNDSGTQNALLALIREVGSTRSKAIEKMIKADKNKLALKQYQALQKVAFAKKYNKGVSEGKSADIIKELINTDWSKDNEAQMKAVQLLKGIALSDEPEANAFMKKLDQFTSSMKIEEALQAMDFGSFGGSMKIYSSPSDLSATMKDDEAKTKVTIGLNSSSHGTVVYAKEVSATEVEDKDKIVNQDAKKLEKNFKKLMDKFDKEVTSLMSRYNYDKITK